jgi:hypothetical protein
LFIKSCTVVPDCSTLVSNCLPPAVPPPLASVHGRSSPLSPLQSNRGRQIEIQRLKTPHTLSMTVLQISPYNYC